VQRWGGTERHTATLVGTVAGLVFTWIVAIVRLKNEFSDVPPRYPIRAQ